VTNNKPLTAKDLEPDVRLWVLTNSAETAVFRMTDIPKLVCVTSESDGSSNAQIAEAITAVFRRCLHSQPKGTKSDVAVLRYLCRVEIDKPQSVRNKAAVESIPAEHKLNSGPSFRRSKYYQQLLRRAAAILLTEELRILGETTDSERTEPTQPASGKPRLPVTGEIERLIDQGHQMLMDHELDDASRTIEKAVLAAVAAGDGELERRGRRLATRVLCAIAADRHRDPGSITQQHQRAMEHLTELERLGERASYVTLLKLMLALSDEPDDATRAIDLATVAYDQAMDEKDFENAAESLIYWLQGLWRSDALDVAMTLRVREEDVLPRLVKGTELRVMLPAYWLRTLCRTHALPDGMVNEWCEDIEETVAIGDEVTPQRAIVLLGEVVRDLSDHGRITDAVEPCLLAATLAEVVGNPTQCASINLQTAEVLAEGGDNEAAESRLAIAYRWLDQVQETADAHQWRQAQVVAAFTRARIQTTRASVMSPSTARTELLNEAHDDLMSARRLIADDPVLKVSAELMMADIDIWIGRTLEQLLRHHEAAKAFGRAHADPVMRVTGYASDLGERAWLAQAQSLLLAGDSSGALTVVTDLLSGDIHSEGIREQATNLREYIDEVLLPLRSWLSSSDATDIAEQVAEGGINRVIAAINGQLLSVWDTWKQDTPSAAVPLAEALDFWGRGGFARLAAAIQARPYAAVVVDARSVDEIRRLCRVLCPLFEVVVVKWKGELGSGLVIAPMPGSHGGSGSFGGHGYVIGRGEELRPNNEASQGRWYPATSWANPIPIDLAKFLAHEACGLMRTGRLVLLPAPLVGCAQHAVGWSDQLLVDGLLGGAVAATQLPPAGPVADSSSQRVLDLASHTIPYIDGVSLNDLGSVLEDTEEWAAPFRAMLFRAMGDGGLRNENWSAVNALENEFRIAARTMAEGLTGVVDGRWSVGTMTSSVSVASRGRLTPGDHDSVTDALRAVASPTAPTGPWVPYFRLTGLGGRLKWSSRLDNPSVPSPTEGGCSHSWLYPGNAGGAYAVVRKQAR
jgi:hypothetical protein